MGETFGEYFQRRGSLGVIIVLKDGPHRFTDLADALHISDSTLTKRLGEARDLGLIVPEMDERDTSIKEQYRITERGQYVVGKLEQLDVVHAYRTFLDMYHQIEDGNAELVEWVDDEEVKREISQKGETDPYIDPFGYNVAEENPDRRYE